MALVTINPEHRRLSDNVNLNGCSYLPEEVFDFIMKLHDMRPEWQLKATPYSMADTSIRILEQKVCLGTVAYEGGWFRISDAHRRINETLRLSCKRTKSITKALGLTCEYLRLPDWAETAKGAHHTARIVLDGKLKLHNEHYRSASHRLRSAFIEFVDADPQVQALYAAYVQRPENTALQIWRESADRETQTLQELKALRFTAPVTVVVALPRDQYLVSPHEGGQPGMSSSSTLSENMRMKLGMLKLLSVGDHIPDIGCRTAENQFLIVSTPYDRNPPDPQT